MKRARPTLPDPPRRLPGGLYWRVFFGGPLQQFGWLLALLLAVPCLWLTIAATDLTSRFVFSGELVRETGTVVESGLTGVSVGDNRHGGKPVYRNAYTWKDAQGAIHEAKSYATGTLLDVGSRVEIEHPPGDPSKSRIVGMRRSLLGNEFALLAIFAVVPIAMVGAGLGTGIRGARLLEQGYVAEAKLVGKEPTNTRVNNQLVYAYKFAFRADDGTERVHVVRTHDATRITDEETERLLYDPRDPSRAVLFDELPGDPRITEDGELEPKSPAPVLILPFLVLLGNAVGAWLVLG